MSSIKFAIFTDTHLGYKYDDPKIGNDSFIVFDECMSTAVNEHCDAILHAGDMFNDGTLKQSVIVRIQDILWTYLVMDPNPDLEAIQYPNIANSGLTKRKITTSDDEVNIKIPFFVINGNHDQPSGLDRQSNCDVLSSSRLVNYFDKYEDLQDITLKPVIMQRDNVIVAIYGLHYLAPTRFVKLLQSQAIHFQDPPTDNGGPRRFNILLLHQDRVQRDNSIKIEQHLAQLCPWMNLIVWGHEHGNKLETELMNSRSNMKIAQIGSTIVTQLKEDETTPRGMLILEVFEDREEYRPIRLTATRAFIMSKVIIGPECVAEKSEELLNRIRAKLDEMIDQRDVREEQPLIRLSIESEVDLRRVNLNLLLTEYSERIANSSFYHLKKKNQIQKKQETNQMSDIKSTDRINTLLERKLNKKLSFLSIHTLNRALDSFIDHNDNNAFVNDINRFIESRQNYLIEHLSIEDRKVMNDDDTIRYIEETISEMSNSESMMQDSLAANSPEMKSEEGENSPVRTTLSLDEDQNVESHINRRLTRPNQRKPRTPIKLTAENLK